MQFERTLELAEFPVLRGFTGRGNIKSVVLDATKLTALNEIQQITLLNDPAGGNLKLKYAGETTGNIKYNASAAEIDTALEALTAIPAGGVTCSGGPLNEKPVLVQFTGGLAASVQELLIADASGLTTGGQDAPDVQIVRTQLGRPAGGPDASGRFTYYEGTILGAKAGDKTCHPYAAESEEEIVGILGARIELMGTDGSKDNRPAAGFFHNCVFDKSKIIGFSTHQEDLEKALTTCLFE